ncbi:MAG: hypothetical protein PWR16_2266 [Methanoculleus sp.]|nr:hypothetical protein [Methanoculleus sp.]
MTAGWPCRESRMEECRPCSRCGVEMHRIGLAGRNINCWVPGRRGERPSAKRGFACRLLIGWPLPGRVRGGKNSFVETAPACSRCSQSRDLPGHDFPPSYAPCGARTPVSGQSLVQDLRSSPAMSRGDIAYRHALPAPGGGTTSPQGKEFEHRRCE